MGTGLGTWRELTGYFRQSVGMSADPDEKYDKIMRDEMQTLDRGQT